jgi:hypothetical protein
MARTSKPISGGRLAAASVKIAFAASNAFAGLFGLASVGHAAGAERVEVRFLQPERFADAEDNERDRERALEELSAHLKRQAVKRLGEGQNLLIEVRDLDLAGAIEPVGPSMHRLRVLRDVTWPRMKLHYVLKSGSDLLREGDAELNRMGYLDGVMPYFESEPYRYEKAMLDDWLKSEFPSKR